MPLADRSRWGSLVGSYIYRGEEYPLIYEGCEDNSSYIVGGGDNSTTKGGARGCSYIGVRGRLLLYTGGASSSSYIRFGLLLTCEKEKP